MLHAVRKHMLLVATMLALSLGGAGVALASEDGDDDDDGYRDRDGHRSSLPQGSEAACLDPDDFTLRIDNGYWPMAPGSTWVYRETGGETEQRIEVRVTDDTRTIVGITARVVRDVVTADGELVEDTYDWYAQDEQGNIWYLGEDTSEYENGEVVSTEGSWEAGVDGAQPGVIIPARPRVGIEYRQEYLEGEAEDSARVLSLDEQVGVAAGHFDDVLMTKDFTPLEPSLLEHKFYARNVGPALSLGISGSSARTELLSFAPGSFDGLESDQEWGRPDWRCSE
jgi:hypothetical protein